MASRRASRPRLSHAFSGVRVNSNFAKELKDPRTSEESEESEHIEFREPDYGFRSSVSQSGRRPDGKIVLNEADEFHHLGFSFPTWRKWSILTVIFITQCSMNFNSSVYGNAVGPMMKRFGIDAVTGRMGQMVFLVAYAFGCELWAPWSEELGRKPILQASLGLVNLWQIPCALAPNFNVILAMRFLGGLSSAGGSVTLGMVADMYEPDDQQYAVAYIVLSSVGGAALGPIAGGFIEEYLPWYWNFWIQLIFGLATQLLHYIVVPETRSSVMLDRLAKRRRMDGQPNVYGPGEIKEHRFEAKEVIQIWIRPFKMFLCEPIVLFLSLLSGFSDSLIFTFLESYTPVFTQWGFGPVQIGLAFLALEIGYVIAWLSFMPFIHRDNKVRAKDKDALQPERRLYWLLWVAPLEAIGLFGFAFTSMGPPQSHWIAPILFSMLIGIANYSIYMATIDYMIASYGPYSASATGGNGFSRDFLAGIAALYSTPFYSSIGSGALSLEIPSAILGVLAILVAVPIYVFYWKGPEIRRKSRFAQVLASDRRAFEAQRASSVASRGRV